MAFEEAMKCIATTPGFIARIRGGESYAEEGKSCS
jgi:hypothetical protein